MDEHHWQAERFEVGATAARHGFAKSLPADYTHADRVNRLALRISVIVRDPDYANPEESVYA